MSFKEVPILKKLPIVNVIHFRGMSKDEGINIGKKKAGLSENSQSM